MHRWLFQFLSLIYKVPLSSLFFIPSGHHHLWSDPLQIFTYFMDSLAGGWIDSPIHEISKWILDEEEEERWTWTRRMGPVFLQLEDANIRWTFHFLLNPIRLTFPRHEEKKGPEITTTYTLSLSPVSGDEKRIAFLMSTTTRCIHISVVGYVLLSATWLSPWPSNSVWQIRREKI